MAGSLSDILTMRLGKIGELGLIQRIKGKLGRTDERVVLGIDDDAAVYRVTPDKLLVFTTDSLVEGVHFDLEYTTLRQLGWKAVAVNVSDIAAMGGVPTIATVSLCLPEGVGVESVENFFEGVAEAGREWEVDIVGGDLSASPWSLVVSVAMVGEVEPERLVTRAGAKPGDALCVTGELGSSAAGLKVLKARKESIFPRLSSLVNRHLTPLARAREARVLVEHFSLHAMIDLSDGLASDLNHICRSSGVGAEVLVDQVPIFPLASEVARTFGDSPLDYALKGGEDFELLFTLPEREIEGLCSLMLERTGTKITVIGRILEAEEGVQLVHFGGRRIPLLPEGYDHFRP